MRSMSLVAMILLCSCGPSIQSGAGQGVTLRVEPNTVSAGDSVTLVLANGSPGEIGYNLCSSGLERQVGSEWQTVPSDRVCTMELRILPPGEEARYPLDTSAQLAPGEYRFVTNIDMIDGGGPGGIRSAPFRLQG